MLRKFSAYFNLTSKERSGFFVLFLLLFIGLLAHFTLRILQERSPLPIEIVALEPLHIAEKSDRDRDETAADQLLSPPRNGRTAGYPKPFVFDPNTATDSDWVRLGLTDRQASVITNYVAKGGRFRRTEDLQKMYSVQASFYRHVAPYIRIADPKKVAQQTYADGPKPVEEGPKSLEAARDHSTSTTWRVEVNTADTSTWKRLRGVGDVFSARIVKFRDALGGFYSIAQVKEVYGISEELFVSIAPFLTIDTGVVRRLPINSLEVDALKRHPYIGTKEASSIVNYRRQHGDFHSIGDLEKIIPLNKEFLRKIEPYLDYSRYDD